MKYLKQLAYIFLLCVVGQLVSNLTGKMIPGNVFAMILLFVLLAVHVIPLRVIEDASDYILTNMAFFFLPACVGIIDSYELLQGNVIKLLFVCIVTTILTAVSAGYTVKIVLHLMKKRRK